MSIDSSSDAAQVRKRWNRSLWVAFAIIVATQLWPLRELGNRIEPSVGGVPFTVLWHVVAVVMWIAVYLLWMTKVWTPAADSREKERPSRGER